MQQKSEGVWTRVCPQCDQTIEHKNRNKCHFADKNKRPCIKCSRSNIGKGHSELDVCPVCGKNFAIKHADEHAKIHGVSGEELWLKKHVDVEPKMCGCGCGKRTKWNGWKNGYNTTFIRGHASSIWSAFSPERAKEISEKRKASLRGKQSWAKGLTKETDERVAERAKRTAEGIRRSYENGRTSWNNGLTKETDERISKLAERVKHEFETGHRIQWAKGLTELTDERLKKKNDDLRRKYATGELSVWHKDSSVQDDPRIAKCRANRDPGWSAKLRISNEEIEKRLEMNYNIRLERIENYKNSGSSSLWMNCTSCDWFDKVSLNFAENDRCPKCTPVGSKLQHNVADWIDNELKFKVMRNARGFLGRRELDIYVPERMLGIELNGLYWHSEEAGKDNQYHDDKARKCSALGIRLLHFFEDEWYHKQPIVKSIIKNVLLNENERVMARKCELVKLASSEKKTFFSCNHLEGDVQSSVAFGLKFNGEIVQAVSCRTPQHKKYKDSLEIARSCSRLNTTVVGGLSRLMTAVKRHAQNNGYANLLTYVDQRFGIGKGYELCGFELLKTTTPRFWWTDYHKRYNRFKFKADKSTGRSEAQVAAESGVVKIWGCSNRLYSLKL